MIIRAAACNENGEGELEVSPYPGDHKIPVPGITTDNVLRPANTYLHRVPVRFIRLDDELREHGVQGIDYLSVTVNGAELEVLKGTEELAARGSPARPGLLQGPRTRRGRCADPQGDPAVPGRARLQDPNHQR